MNEHNKPKEPEEKIKQLGRYLILRKLGEGSVGTVYQAQDTSLDRGVAIKILSKRAAADANTLQRFIREAKMSAKLRHPNIVTTYEFEQIAGVYCLVMDFIEGLSLESLLQNQSLPIARVCEIMLGMVDAIQYAHEQGLVHRDIKPANILIAKDGTPFLTDFGIAKDITPEKDLKISHTGEMLGTLAYMAPEQIQDTKHATDSRSDIYSLGAVLYKMLTGKIPFDVENPFAMMYKATHAKILNPRKINPAIASELEHICLKALAKDKEDRYQTAAEMAQALRQYMDMAHESERPVPSRPPITTTLKFSWHDPLHVAIVWSLVLVGFISSWLVLKYMGPKTKSPKENPPTIQKTHIEPTAHSAAQVSLKIVPIYDLAPPVDYTYKLRVSFKTETITKIVSLEGDSITPGTYQLLAVLPGYMCQEHGKAIEVRPGHLFHLTLSLNAVQREIAPYVVHAQTGEKVTPVVYQVDRKPVAGNHFRPGDHQVYAFFENYQGLDTTIHIPLGDVPFEYEAALVPLQEITVPLQELLAEISHIRKNDGTSYDLEIYVDDKKIPQSHFKYQFQGAEIYGAKLHLSVQSREIRFRCGFYYTTLPADKLHFLSRLDRIDAGLLLAHLSELKERDLFAKDLEFLWNKDRNKLSLLTAEAKKRVYEFLAKNTSSGDFRELDSPLWSLRRLLNTDEADQHKFFEQSCRQAETMNFAERAALWQAFLQKYPQTIYQQKIEATLEYLKDVIRYEETFRDSVRECYLSTSEKRILQRLESKLKPEDITQVKKRIAEYVKKLGCDRSLEEMLHNR